MAAQPQVINLVNPNEHTFTVAGNPVPMPRPRFNGRNFFIPNEARRAREHFQEQVKIALPATRHGTIYGPRDALTITLIFNMLRPQRDFVNSDRHRELKTSALLRTVPPTGPDIDNLAKFVLDALNELVFPDDRQVVELVCFKFRDNEGECLGRTEVKIAPHDG